MSVFVILLQGSVTPTPRLRAQVKHARVIAADGGMRAAEALHVIPELWVGDFDSTDERLLARYDFVPRQHHPVAKDATDGALAIEEAIERGATRLLLVGALGGRSDHATAHMGLMLQLARRGIPGLLTSGEEEAYALTAGHSQYDLPAGSRFSIVPWSDLKGLSLKNVEWPLQGCTVELGSSLTLSNIALGPVTVQLDSGYGMIFTGYDATF